MSAGKSKRLLVTGSRHGWDHDHLMQVLEEWHATLSEYGQQVVLVHGDAEGVDRQAADHWAALGRPTEAHPAKWAEYGMRAGPIRNTEMVRLNADQCIAFPGERSIGTHDCATKAKRWGIPTVIYRAPGTILPPVLDGQLDLFDGEKD